MWKRHNRQPTRTGTDGSSSGTSDLLDTLEEYQRPGSNTLSISARPAFGRKSTKDVLQDGLQKLPFPLPPEQAIYYDNPRAAIRTASSIYSQSLPHSVQVSKLEIPRASSIYPDDGISPPDSPTYQAGTQQARRNNIVDVSPIDSGPDAVGIHPEPVLIHKHHNSTSNPCQETNGGVTTYPDLKSMNGNYDSLGRASAITRWDDFSGEPTTNEKGKPAQVIQESSNFDPGVDRLLDNGKISRMVSTSGQGTPHSRKGLFQLVPPVEHSKLLGTHAKPTAHRLSMNKPLPPTKPPEPTGRSPAYLRDTNQQDVMRTRNSPRYGWIHGTKDLDDTIKPIVPLKISRKSSPSTITPPASGKSQHLTLNARSELDTRSPLTRNPSCEQLTNHILYADEDLPFHSGRKSSDSTQHAFRSIQTLNPRHEVSRFSTTTYATTVPESPPSTSFSDSESPSEAEAPSPMLNRRRPIRTTGVSVAKGTARKPTPSDLRASSLTDVEETGNLKSLPQSPPEIAAIDRIAVLQAKMDNLYRRKANLKTVIHELTHVIQPSSIAYDTASRQEIKKTVDGLNKELDEVTKEEYDTGLRLHRTSKHRDDNSMYEPTGLWVRRVTT